MRHFTVLFCMAVASLAAPIVASGQGIEAKLGDDTTATFVVKDGNDQEILVLEAKDQTTQSPNVIAGHNDNSVTAGAYGATISGGGKEVGDNNIVTDIYGTVGGGRANQAGDSAGTTSDADSATVGGGYQNTASDGGATVGGGYTNTASYNYATVGGGSNNTASAYATTVGGGNGNTASDYYATVGGGQGNTASYSVATVGGGYANTASGDGSTVPGGLYNTAAGHYSFAAGRRAKANSPGCFVWGDSTGTDVTCSTSNRWVARTTGGVDFFTNSTMTTGVTLAAGGSAWGAVSDRAVKENFSPVDRREVLEKVAAMPIEEWNLKTQDPSIRHIGPVAQDFNGSFGYGESERHINMMDATGVTMAAVQGLYEVVQSQRKEIETLEAKARRIDELETRLSELTRLVRGTGASE